MSDDAPPARSARNHDSPASARVGDHDFPLANEAAEARDTGSSTRSRSVSRQRRRRRSRSTKKRHPGLAKKLSFLTHLLKSLDTVVIAELSGLYYMECSLFRFLIRSAGHFMYLTPKDEAFPIYMPATLMHVLFIFIPNIFCIISHLVSPLPVGPDYHRGYQHGGLIVDFVGQKPPAYRLYYCLTDLVILAIQCLMLAVHTERENLRAALQTFNPVLPVAEQPTTVSREELDAEERGVAINTSVIISDDSSGFELQPMRRSRDEAAQRSDDTAPLLPVASGGSSPVTPLSDVMASGNAIIGQYHVLQSLRSASMGLERTAAHSLQTISYGATMAALQARQRGASARAPSPHPNR
ncbi:hypothetical protein XA68_11511 [Ophiocordyceps unilateralis]|uniref:DUF1746 domain-containing protein n=1 Tax=Ophiocordyceps unilateralis TaxID=268505 RepID=A0A2A9PGM6_OPHUN|nr:hypothetical protein XA68_11511 [Ophiocordyceps unilateralis]